MSSVPGMQLKVVINLHKNHLSNSAQMPLDKGVDKGDKIQNLLLLLEKLGTEIHMWKRRPALPGRVSLGLWKSNFGVFIKFKK